MDYELYKILNMKTNNEYCVIMTTFADAEEMNKVVEVLLNSKLAACIQAINIGSHYTWNQEICHENEILLLIKTLWIKYEPVKDMIKKYHSYETPEIIALNIDEGDLSYLNWINEITK